jgi:hypothetical protein
MKIASLTLLFAALSLSSAIADKRFATSFGERKLGESHRRTDETNIDNGDCGNSGKGNGGPSEEHFRKGRLKMRNGERRLRRAQAPVETPVREPRKQTETKVVKL